MGMFGLSPDEVQQQQDADNQKQAFNIAGLTNGQLTNYNGALTGQMLGSGIDSLFGTKDPQMERAKKLEQIQAQTEQISPFDADPLKHMKTAIGLLQHAGLGTEAANAMKHYQEFANSQASTNKAQAELNNSLKEKQGKVKTMSMNPNGKLDITLDDGSIKQVDVPEGFKLPEQAQGSQPTFIQTQQYLRGLRTELMKDPSSQNIKDEIQRTLNYIPSIGAKPDKLGIDENTGQQTWMNPVTHKLENVFPNNQTNSPQPTQQPMPQSNQSAMPQGSNQPSFSQGVPAVATSTNMQIPPEIQKARDGTRYAMLKAEQHDSGGVGANPAVDADIARMEKQGYDGNNAPTPTQPPIQPAKRGSDAINVMAWTSLIKDKQPTKQLAIPVANEISAIANDLGMTKEEIISQSAQVKARLPALAKINKDITTIEPFHDMLNKNGSIAIDLGSKIAKNAPALLNRKLNWLNQNVTVNPDLSEYLAQVHFVATEGSRILSNPNLTGPLTDSARADFKEILDGNMPLDNVIKVINRIKLDGNNRIDAMTSARDKLGNSIGIKAKNAQTPSKPSTPANKPAPQGVDPKLWSHMTPEEKALF